MKELQNRNLISEGRKYSTKTALIRIVDQLLFLLDNDEVSCLLLVDFRKAFDIVNHQLLLNKLRAFGVGKRFVECFQSYLLNRYQFVSVNGVSSEKLCVQSGVPQGLVLGPVLFIIFINDLPQMVQDSVVDIFADDTTLSHASHFANVNATRCVLQTSADNFVKWSDDNFMVLNSTKTKSMSVTGTRLKKKLTSDHQSLRINIDGKQIEQASLKIFWE